MNRLLLEGIRAGRPRVGPATVHIDITNRCNATCVSCWDHSPLLRAPRPAEWRSRRMDLPDFAGLLDQLDALGSVRALILSGMGEPLTHPGIGPMLDLVARRPWKLTLITNLVDPRAPSLLERLDPSRHHLLVGVHGVRPDTYEAFHPGWDESHFFRLCRHLRLAGRIGLPVRHVQVITRHNAHELVEMARFGIRFGAGRVNYKLASLANGTERIEITDEQRARLPALIRQARALGCPTNLDRFEEQLAAGAGATTDPEAGCYMGYAYARVTVDGDVLFCCNTRVRVGSLRDGDLETLWFGDRWQDLRRRIAQGQRFPGCDRCGKHEQNVKIGRALA